MSLNISNAPIKWRRYCKHEQLTYSRSLEEVASGDPVVIEREFGCFSCAMERINEAFAATPKGGDGE